MKTARLGDRVEVHYIKRLPDGGIATSRNRAPLRVTVGQEHPRLPGIGEALVGLAPGERTRIVVPSDRVGDKPGSQRLAEFPRNRFSPRTRLRVGRWAPIVTRHGLRRFVRVVSWTPSTVLVDTNRRESGQAIDLEIELVAIQ